jgi:hypothetical protein
MRINTGKRADGILSLFCEYISQAPFGISHITTMSSIIALLPTNRR